MSVYYYFYFDIKWMRVHIPSVLNSKKLTIYRAYFVTGYCYNPETVGPWAFGIANEKLGGFVSSNICT